MSRCRAGRSKRPRSGSRSTRRRCGSGATGSSPKATPGCWIGRVVRTGHRTGLRDRVDARGAAAASEASLGRGSHRVRGRHRRRRRCSAILRAAGCGRLDRGDRATDTSPVQRYQRERPGELIHVDVKKLAAIPDGRRLADPRPRQRTATRGHTAPATATSTPRSMTAPASSTPRSSTTNKAITAADVLAPSRGMVRRRIGITCERVITDNGACYRSRALAPRLRRDRHRP